MLRISIIQGGNLLNKDFDQRFSWLEKDIIQWAFNCSKLTVETHEQGVKHVQTSLVSF